LWGAQKKQSAVTTKLFCPDIAAFIMDSNIQTKVEMLTSVHIFVDLQLLLMSLERLIKSGEFSGPGDSTVMQFKKDCTNINFGVRGESCFW
jgi:hypothetical protein